MNKELLCLKTLKYNSTEYFTKGMTYPVVEFISKNKPVVRSNVGSETMINLKRKSFALLLA